MEKKQFYQVDFEMTNTQVTPKYGETTFKDKLVYETNIKLEDITDSLSSHLVFQFGD